MSLRRGVWAGLGIAGVAFAALLWFTFRDALGPTGDLLPVRPGLLGVETGASYAWILEVDDKPVLIDGGMDGSATAIVAALASQGWTRRDVRTILLTHSHPDHIGGLSMFPDATVYAHPDDLDVLTGAAEPGTWLARLMLQQLPTLAAAPVSVADGDSVTLSGGHTALAIHVPGHTPGSLAWMVDGTLFSGDALMRTRGGVGLAPWPVNADTAQAGVSAHRLGDLSADMMCDGHVGSLPDPTDAIAAFLGTAR